MAGENPAMNVSLSPQEYKDPSKQPGIAPAKPTKSTFTVGSPRESILLSKTDIQAYTFKSYYCRISSFRHTSKSEQLAHQSQSSG